MCLGTPGRIVELLDEEHLARVETNGVGRVVDVGLVDDGPLAVGDWVLVHVGFAMARIDEEQARETLAALQAMGEAYARELAAWEADAVPIDRPAEVEP